MTTSFAPPASKPTRELRWGRAMSDIARSRGARRGTFFTAPLTAVQGVTGDVAMILRLRDKPLQLSNEPSMTEFAWQGMHAGLRREMLAAGLRLERYSVVLATEGGVPVLLLLAHSVRGTATRDSNAVVRFFEAAGLRRTTGWAFYRDLTDTSAATRAKLWAKLKAADAESLLLDAPAPDELDPILQAMTQTDTPVRVF